MVDTPLVIVAETPATTGPVGVSAETGQKRTVDLSDKLKIINEALFNTGNNPVNIGDDTSDEWRVASSAFDQCAMELRNERTWNFLTRIQVLNRVGDSAYPGCTDVFAKPADCLYLEYVWRSDLGPLIFPVQSSISRETEIRPPDYRWKVIGDHIHCVAPAGATCTYIPYQELSEPWSALFVKALRYRIESIIYRALNEDMQASVMAGKLAQDAVSEANARASSEEPRRVGFRSVVLESRTRRNLRGWL